MWYITSLYSFVKLLSQRSLEIERRRRAISRSVSGSRWHTRTRSYCATCGRKKSADRCESGHNDRECSVRARPHATRCDFWMNRRVVMTHRSPRRDSRPINRVSELIVGSFEREGTRGGKYTFDTARSRCYIEIQRRVCRLLLGLAFRAQ